MSAKNILFLSVVLFFLPAVIGGMYPEITEAGHINLCSGTAHDPACGGPQVTTWSGCANENYINGSCGGEDTVNRTTPGSCFQHMCFISVYVNVTSCPKRYMWPSAILRSFGLQNRGRFWHGDKRPGWHQLRGSLFCFLYFGNFCDSYGNSGCRKRIYGLVWKWMLWHRKL